MSGAFTPEERDAIGAAFDRAFPAPTGDTVRIETDYSTGRARVAPPRFRKRPVEIEAMQWDGTFDGYLAIARWCGHAVEWRPERTHDTSERPDGTSATFERAEPVPQHVRLFVAANDAWLRLTPGEWILRDALGFYPCKPDMFAETYEAAAPTVTVQTYGGEARNLTAAVQVRVIPEGEPFDGPLLGTVTVVAPPEHVDEARRVISEALRIGEPG